MTERVITIYLEDPTADPADVGDLAVDITQFMCDQLGAPQGTVVIHGRPGRGGWKTVERKVKESNPQP